MILTWMLYTVLISLLIAAGARGLDEVCRSARLPMRFVWLGALLVTVGLAALAPLRTALPDAAEPVSAVELFRVPMAVAADAADATAWSHSVAETFAALRQAVQWPLRAAASGMEGGAGLVLGIGWMALSLGLLGLGTATLLRCRTSLRSWPIRDIAGVQVRMSPAAGPAVLGFPRPEIVVPEWLMERSPEEQRLVLLHEREHLRAHDPLILFAGCLTAALIPWNPIVWWMLLRLRLAVELDCDRRVLCRGVRPHAYGVMLIDMAGRGSGLAPGVPAFAGSPSTLERRLLAMSTRFSGTAAVRAAAFGVLGAAALLAACDTRMPTAAEVGAMDVSAMEAQAREWKLVTPGAEDVTYYLDGVQVSAEEARAILPERLAQVEIIRSGAAGESASIRLTSHSRDLAAEASAIAEHGTDAAEEGRREKVTAMLRANPEREVSVTPVSNFEGLLMIDGVRAESSDLRNLRSDRIESVEVIKGPAAARAYDDPRAAHGVIRVTTKRAAAPR